MTGFAGVYRAVYGYSSASEQELSLQENDLLYLIEKADDGWWTVKKRVPGAASEEPEGIVPHNYIEPAKPEPQPARALYSYDRQTEEELSFTEGTVFDIYATDGDWVLVGKQNGNEYGFVPNNYIEKISASTSAAPAAAASLAPVGGARAAASTAPAAPSTASHPAAPPQSEDVSPPRPQRPQRTGDIVTEDNAPPRPMRPDQHRPPREMMDRDLPEEPSSKQDESKHSMWPVTDISGRRKVAKTLVVAPTYVTLINDDGGGRTQKWDVHDIKSYSSEKKHVFLDLFNPTASLELKAASQSEADRIVASLGQVVGAGRGGGLEEVLAAAKSAGHKQGQIVLDFKAANSRELSVTEYETVFVINDSDHDWWLVRNVSGKEGLVPRKFVHIDKKDGKISDFFKGKKQKDKQRDREIERKHESARNHARELSREKSTSGRGDRVSRRRSTHGDRSLPDSRKMRLWVDRSGTFKVDAQLLGCSDGKVHLHKANGVKIAVPVSKLSFGDIEYVEGVTGVNLNDDKPLVDRRPSQRRHHSRTSDQTTQISEDSERRNDSWLSFFLSCGVDPQNANRYAKNFTRDNMDESTLGDVNASVLRTLGLREGDILRVTKKINEKLGRVQNPGGGLYSNEGGALQNNTGTTPANVENQVWNSAPQSMNGGSKGVSPQPALQPQQTAAAQNIQPQLTQAPTGALADLLGVGGDSNKQPGSGAITPSLTGNTAPAQVPTVTGPSTAALIAQKTAEAQVALQQRQTQHQILRQQAELQKEQIRLLREQQEQLRRQQGELVQIQKTGSQLQALGPFATGVAQQSNFAPSAAAVLSAPQPPQPRVYQPIQQPAQTGFSVQPTNSVFPQQPTGPFSQTALPSQPTASQPATSFVSQTTGPFTQQRTGPLSQPQTTGPFSAMQPTMQPTIQPTTSFAPQTTGPFGQQRTGPLVQSQPTGPFAQQSVPTGPFASAPQQQLPQLTGPFASAPTTPQPRAMPSQPTGPFSMAPNPQQPTGIFQPSAPTPAAPFTSFGSTPASQPNITGQLSGLQLGNQPTGPFSQQSTPAPTTMFGQQQRTGPFQPQQPMQATQLPPVSFGSSAQLNQQRTGPFSQFNSVQSTGVPQLSGFQSQNPSQPMLPLQQPQLSNAAGLQSMGNIFPTQPVAQPQPQTSVFPTAGQTGLPQTSFGQPSAQPMGQIPLQSQATGFGFGNQPQQPVQQPMQQRANFNMASASNPFGL